MILGSHNSMSYLPPLKWWMRPFHFIVKCQDKDIHEQYKCGVRIFDIRIAYEYTVPCFAHGIIKFKRVGVGVWRTLSIINEFTDCTVRIVLESNKEKDIKLFKRDVENYIKTFENIKFIEGTRKSTWEKLIDIPAYTGLQLVSSMTGTIFDDWFPRLYAKFNNKKNIAKYKDTDKEVLIDFVGVY